MPGEQVVKSHGCGFGVTRHYTASQWERLKYVGRMDAVPGAFAHVLELRLCVCGSCIALRVL